MVERKEPSFEVIAAGAVGFIGGAIVGKYLLDEILSEEEIDELKEDKVDFIYKCPNCKNILKFGDNYCSKCGTALQWRKKEG